MANSVDVKVTQELLADSKWCRALEKMDADADKATRAAKALLSNPDVALVPDQFSSEMISCGMKFKAADTAFKKVRIAVTNGKCGSKEFVASFMEFGTQLQALQEIVACCDGIVKAKPMITLGLILAAAKFVTDGKIKQMATLKDRMENLVTALKKANKTVTKAEWAKYLNAALSTATLAFAPEATLLKVAAGLSGILGHIAIDNFLGPKGVTVSSTSRTLIGDAPDVIEGSLTALGEYMEAVEDFLKDAEKSIGAAAKGLGAGAAVATLIADSDEVEEAEKAVNEIKEALEAAQKSVEFAEKTTIPLVRQLPQIEKALSQTSKAVQQAIAASADAAMNYNATIAMVKKL